MKHDSASIREVIAKGIVNDMGENIAKEIVVDMGTDNVDIIGENIAKNHSLLNSLLLFFWSIDKKEYITQCIALRNIKKEKVKQLKKKSCTSLTEILKKELNSISDFELQEEKFECNISIPNYLNEKSGEKIAVCISVVALAVAIISMIGTISSEFAKTIIGLILPFFTVFLLLDFEFLRFVVKSSRNSERKMYYAFKLQCINEVLAEKENAAKE